MTAGSEPRIQAMSTMCMMRNRFNTMATVARSVWRSLLAKVRPEGPSRIDLPSAYPDLSADDLALLASVDAFTMTSLERRHALLQSVRHIIRHQITGDIVECGVWRGGSMMLVAKALNHAGIQSRDLYLYDTFEGMPPPSEEDQDAMGTPASILMREDAGSRRESHLWAVATLEDVRRNLSSTGYPEARFHYVSGRVEQTIPATIPSSIALLRLDTDWYESTAHELAHLYPRVVSGGIVIIDDYGHWKGARKAVDEFLQSCPDRIFLNRIDNTGRAFVKP